MHNMYSSKILEFVKLKHLDTSKFSFFNENKSNLIDLFMNGRLVLPHVTINTNNTVVSVNESFLFLKYLINEKELAFDLKDLKIKTSDESSTSQEYFCDLISNIYCFKNVDKWKQNQISQENIDFVGDLIYYLLDLECVVTTEYSESLND